MIYVCTEVKADGAYSRELEANSWAEAEAECNRLGWHLEGELEMLIDAESGAVVVDMEECRRVTAALLAGVGDANR